MPVAPVAPFSQQQQQAFGEVGAAQGMAQPYFQQGANYINQSAQPITQQQVANYYNPMASNVTAQMQNIFGQQDVQNTANLTQAAGGVGSDRIAVGQGQLANQQGLAAGQTYAGLYQSALNQAQQTAQMQANAGYGMANIGAGAQGAQLQGAQALLGTGGLQQAQSQAQLNAPYQQQLAQIAYPFQTAQYLAGVTGSLAPALGGTTQGQTTYPAPNLTSQIAGLGLGGIGLIGGTGGFGANGWLTQGMSGLGNSMSGLSAGASPYTGYSQAGADGGRINGYDDGGSVPQIPGPSNYGMPYSMASQGIPPVVPNMPFQGGPNNQPKLMPISQSGAQMPPPPGSQPSGGTGKGSNVFQPLQQSGAFGANGWANYQSKANLASQDAAQDAQQDAEDVSVASDASGGGVGPYAMGQGYDDGGDVDYATPDETIASRWANVPPDVGTGNMGTQPNMYGAPPSGTLAPAEPGSFDDRWAGMPTAPMEPTGQTDIPPEATSTMGGIYDGTQPGAMPPAISQPRVLDVADNGKVTNRQTGQDIPQRKPFEGMPANQTPYPHAAEENWGTNLARSPWLAVANAGFGMMGGTSPFAAVNIGRGLQQGVKTLQNQRAEDEKETSANERAKQLWETAQQHLDNIKRQTAQDQKNNEFREKSLLEQKRQHDIQLEKLGLPPGYRKTQEGNLEPIPGGPHDPQAINKQAQAKAATKLDPGLVNELDNYEGLDAGKLANMAPKHQDQVINALRSSEALEDLATFAKQHPDSFGAVANIKKAANWDAFEGFLGTSKGKDAAMNAAIDEAQRKGQINATQAANAKIMNKKITTQALTDAAAAGQGRNSVYLDRKFQELYDQSSSPEAFFGILKSRYDDANRVLRPYKMGFDQRKDLSDKPFWRDGPQDYVDSVHQTRDAQTATASSARTNKAALDWANANPDDPRSVAIKRKLGVQ